MTTVDHENPYR